MGKKKEENGERRNRRFSDMGRNRSSDRREDRLCDII